MTKAMIAGALFQLPMIALFALRNHWFHPEFSFSLDLANILALSGMGVFAFCLVRLYTTRRLITSGPFALTRHPMYHGIFLADVSLLLRNDNYIDFWCWLTWFPFILLMLAAGRYQEQETLARWGHEAHAYYSRTPRYIFGLFSRRASRRSS